MAAENPPSEHRWRDADLDNELLKELASKPPSEERIRELVRQGADVNSVKGGDSVLTDAVTMLLDGLDQEYVRLLIELGADVRWQSDEGNCALYEACLSHDPKTVAFILEHGADPNVVLDLSESMLDWAEFDLWFHEREMAGEPSDSDHARWAGGMARIVSLLKEYGARPLEALDAEALGTRLNVFGLRRTGLLTNGGHITIERISGATDELCQRFRDWLAGYWDSWPNKDWSEMPEGFDREDHNARGRELARQIKRLVGDAVKVKYLCICSESERRHIRNVMHEDVV